MHLKSRSLSNPRAGIAYQAGLVFGPVFHSEETCEESRRLPSRLLSRSASISIVDCEGVESMRRYSSGRLSVFNPAQHKARPPSSL
jgi:hypothetical protein